MGHAVGGRAEPHGVVPVGIGVYATTAGWRSATAPIGNELEQECNLVEAGMARAQGQAAGLRRQGSVSQAARRRACAIMCTLTVDDHTSSSGFKRYMMGREPILTPTANRLWMRMAAART